MKLNKRLAALTLAAASLCALCACGGETAQESQGPSASAPASASASASAPASAGTPAAASAAAPAASSESPDDMAAAYMKAMYEGDAATRLDLLLPEYVAALTEERECQTREELEEVLAPSFQALREEMETKYGADYEVYAVAEESEELGKAELGDLRRWYSGKFELDSEVSAARTVYVHLLVGQEGQEQSVQQEVTVVQIGEDWYVDARAHGFD